jgi:hypothetical protein
MLCGSWDGIFDLKATAYGIPDISWWATHCHHTTWHLAVLVR